MSYEHEFRWESSLPQSVIVSGTFDNWSSSLHLERLDNGKFAGKAQLTPGTKVLFKYIVDGNWQANTNEPTEDDGSGNINNVLHVPEQAKEPETTTESSHHHEAAIAGAGAAAVATGVGAGATVASHESHSVNESTFVPAEKPVDPAPTPAVGVNKADIPSVPSSEQVSSALDKDPEIATKSEVLPLIPETNKVDTTPAHPVEKAPAKSEFLPVVPDHPTATPVSAPTAISGSSALSSTKNKELPSPLAYPSGTLNSASSTSSPVTSVAKETPAVPQKDATPALSETKPTVSESKPSAAQPVADAKSAVAKEPSKKAQVTPPPSVNQASGDKKDAFSTLGKSNKDVFTTPHKANGTVEPSSTTSTPAKDFQTAPSTPATPPHAKGDRARKSSFFQKVKSAFSPSKAK